MAEIIHRRGVIHAVKPRWFSRTNCCLFALISPIMMYTVYMVSHIVGEGCGTSETVKAGQRTTMLSCDLGGDIGFSRRDKQQIDTPDNRTVSWIFRFGKWKRHAQYTPPTHRALPAFSPGNRGQK